MTKISIFFLIVFNIYSVRTLSQTKKEIFITKKELIGTWQKDFDRVGNGLNQSFQFFSDSRFIMTVGKFGDDAVSTIKLKGKYRLEGDKIFFTITSKTVVDGELVMVDPGVDSGIFQYGENSTIKEIKEPHPKEMVDPCYITYIKHGKIALNTNEVYYKVYVQDNER